MLLAGIHLLLISLVMIFFAEEIMVWVSSKFLVDVPRAFLTPWEGLMAAILGYMSRLLLIQTAVMILFGGGALLVSIFLGEEEEEHEEDDKNIPTKSKGIMKMAKIFIWYSLPY